MLTWVQKKPWTASTKASHFSTLTKTLRLKNIAISGDLSGAIRQLKLESIHSPKDRAPPIPLHELLKIATRVNPELRALLHLSWAFAARLTSITNLTRSQIHIQEVDQYMSKIRATFRHGKTISATGPYTITTLIPNQTANWITDQPNRMFTKEITTYYNLLRKQMGNYKIRSIRRGALQVLASRNLPPTDIMLMSRHKHISSLYAYLDDGALAHWEQDTLTLMSGYLWRSAE
jgi:hypothetical protein